jgi:hypothetical protein
MFSFFGRIIKLVIVNVVILAVILYISLSALTGKFPPDFKTINNYTSNMLNFDKNFAVTMSRSEDYIKAMHIDDDPQFAAKVLSGDPSAMAKLNNSLTKKDFSPLEAQIVLLNMQVKELRRELNELKQQLNVH